MLIVLCWLTHSALDFADFGVIDQYLSLRDQVDSEDEFLSVNDSVSWAD